MQKRVKIIKQIEIDGELLRCRCVGKIDDRYLLSCKIHQRGEKNYFYEDGSEHLSVERGRKRLFLCGEALKKVRLVTEQADAYISRLKKNSSASEMQGGRVKIYYTQTQALIYDFLVEQRRDGVLYTYCCPSLELYEAKDTLWQIPNMPRVVLYWCDMLYNTASLNEDKLLRCRLRVLDQTAESEDIEALLRNGDPILPTASSELDREFIVQADTIDYKMLMRSGYRVSHLINMAMRGRTYNKWTLNPYQKFGADNAPENASAITFEEYVKTVIKGKHNE